MSRQQRRAHARMMQKLGTLEHHFNQVLREVRADFERTGTVRDGFVCVSDTEIFHIAGTWPDHDAKGAACAALRDSFRRRGVNRYLFVSEGWTSKKLDLRPMDDPDRGEVVQVIAVERGARKWAMAEITRSGETANLGPWKRDDNNAPQSWLMELLTEGYSDRAVKAEPAPLAELSTQDLTEDLRDVLHAGVEIHAQLDELLEAEQAHNDPMSMFMALECVLRGIVKGMGSPKGLGESARVLRDHPDRYPMFSTVQDQMPSKQHMLSCKEKLQRFVDEKKHEVGANAIFGGFYNVYLFIGSQVIGALELAQRIQEWVPERQEMLRQGGLRSTFELGDEEGRVFLALSAAHHPAGIIGRSNAADELFVTGVRYSRQPDFASAVEHIKQYGGPVDLIFGPEARELFRKMENIGLVPAGDPMKSDEEVWQMEDWGDAEWTEQAAAEFMFAKVIDVQHDFEANQLDGNVAGYRVRRAPDGLVLVPADNDEDIYVAVQVDAAARCGCIRGWLRGSEGKVPQYYQNGRWVIPAEALHDLEDLPGKERLQMMPPFQEHAKEENQNA